MLVLPQDYSHVLWSSLFRLHNSREVFWCKKRQPWFCCDCAGVVETLPVETTKFPFVIRIWVVPPVNETPAVWLNFGTWIEIRFLLQWVWRRMRWRWQKMSSKSGSEVRWWRTSWLWKWLRSAVCCNLCWKGGRTRLSVSYSSASEYCVFSVLLFLSLVKAFGPYLTILFPVYAL